MEAVVFFYVIGNSSGISCDTKISGHDSFLYKFTVYLLYIC